MMESKRRFVFRGNAAAFGGRIYRPTDIVIEAAGASCLPVVGGRSRSQIRGSTFGEVIRIGSASTSAEGFFDDTKQAVEATFHRVAEDALTASTTVSADVTDLSVGRKPVLTAKKVHATLHSHSPHGSGEPSIALDRETTIEGLAIDGLGLVVEFNRELFQKYDRRATLVAAADDAGFVREHGANLYMTAAYENQPAPPAGRLIERNGIIYATIVKSIRWAGQAHSTATIDYNTITIPEVGRLFVGEMMITATSRRLTMLRFELGSFDGGYFCAVDVDSNGCWSP
jgi:hypothetical protein